MLLGEGYRVNSRTSKFCQDLLDFGWVETDEDIAGSFLIEKVDASQEDPGTGARQDVLYGRDCSFRVDAFINADPHPFQDYGIDIIYTNLTVDDTVTFDIAM